jgi:hypothetical protein
LVPEVTGKTIGFDDGIVVHLNRLAGDCADTCENGDQDQKHRRSHGKPL